MTTKKKNITGTKKKNKPEINFVSGNDFYIYELLLGELPAGNNNNNKINKKHNKKINNKLKNQIKTK